MSYISHINKYASSQAIQDALNAGTLANPYVAMTPVGVLDYNTLEPAPVLKIAGQSITGTSAGGGVYEWNSLLNYSGTSFTIEVSNTPITAATWDYTEESLDQCGNPDTPVVATGTSMSVFEANSGYIEWASYSRANNLVSYGSMDDQTSDDPADICECQGGCWDGETCQECDACANWEEMGYASYEECRCSEYGDNCPEEPYDTQYFTIEALEDGDLNVNTSVNIGIQYSLDGGENWENISNRQISLAEGDKALFKNDSIGVGIQPTNLNNLFTGNTMSFNVYGNINSLIVGEYFLGSELTVSSIPMESMFSGCTALISAGNLVLPATTLARECYTSMFNGCTSLTAAPELPATTLAERCYENMFKGCTSLTTAPALPAITLASKCYQSMFDGCSSLNYIKCLATDLGSNNLGGFTNGVAATGTFVKATGMVWPTGTSGIPDGWTVQEEDPTMGVWGGKTFQITETGTTYWEQPVKIGALADVYCDGNLDDLDVMLNYNTMTDEWHMEFYSEMASSAPSYDFPSDSVAETWSTGVMTELDESSSEIVVVYDGANNFTFTVADGFLTTINPEQPEVSPESE